MRFKKKSLQLFFALNCLLAFVITLLPVRANAQSKTPALSVKDVIAKIDDHQLRLPSEKLYITFDKPNYIAGDTIWFKVFLFNAGNRRPSYLSTKAYVELINDSSRVITRLVIPLQNGLGEGDLQLSSTGLADGAYTIRAYTNWMQNFGAEAFFQKRFYIGNDIKINWLVTEQHTIKPTATGKNITLSIQLTDTKNAPVMYKDIQLQLDNGRKTLFKQAVITTDQGGLTTTWAVPNEFETHNLTLKIQDAANKKNSQSFPFYLGDPEAIDIQFMPEGGEMVPGLLNKIAFKAIGNDGLGIDVTGVIVDSRNKEVATFLSEYKGMGSFRMAPVGGEAYSARIKYGSLVKTIPLPLLKANGIVLRVDNTSQPDTVKLFISTTASVAAANKTYILLAQAKDTVYFGSTFNLTKGFYNLVIPKSKFNTGIVNFSLLDENGITLNQRKVFIDRHDRLALNAIASKAGYQLKDSAAVNITVLDANGSPVKNGYFAVSVTDDAQVKPATYGNTILSEILLTSELKGTIEEPGWYFTNEGPKQTRALDNLLLTQGWTGFNPDDLNNLPTKPKFEADLNNHISGKLTNFFNKPISGAGVRIFSTSKYGMVLADTISDEKGEFNFTGLPIVDSIAYTLTAHNKKGKQIPGAIALNEFTPAPVNTVNTTRLLPWYVNSTDKLMLNNINLKQPQPLYGLKPGELKGRVLKEVTINSLKKPVFFDDEFGYPMKELNEKQLIAQGKTTLFNLLNAQYKGFKNSFLYCVKKTRQVTLQRYENFTMNSVLIADFYIDGISVFKTQGPFASGRPESYYEFLYMFLNYVKATEVTHIQLFSGNVYIMNITTRSGAGPWLKVSNGTAVYRPPATYMPRQFYRPRYTASSDIKLADYRSTIHWEPNLITDENGKATLSFYTADKPSTYTVNIEGTDMLGHFGSQSLKIAIASKATASK